MNRYMKNKKAAEYLGLSKYTLYKLGQRRRVPYGKRGRALIYDKVDLDQWAEVCRKSVNRSYRELLHCEGNEMSRYLTHKQASKYLGISKDSLYKLARGGEIPAGKRGKTLIYDKSRLDKWVDQCHKKRGVTLQEAIKNHLKKGAWL